MMTWFRFYQEVLDDPKVQSLDPADFKAWVNLLCLACRHEGKLPSAKDIAFALRISFNDCETLLERLSNGGLIDRRNGGVNGTHNAIHSWEKRQYKSDTSTDRVKRFRERSKTVTVTAPDTDTDTENIVPLNNRARDTRSSHLKIEFGEQFWPLWPNKVGKPAAAAAFEKARKRGATLDQILAGVRQYVREKPPERSWLNPATFLNQERYLDEPAKQAPQARARERDLRNVPDNQLSNDEYWRKRLQQREWK